MQTSIRDAWLVIALVAVSAGTRATQWHVDGPTAADIVATLGDAPGAGGMVSRAIARQLRLDRTPRTVVVLGEQIIPEWLPLTDQVNFVVLNKEQSREHLANCGEYLFVQSVTRDADRATVSIGHGNRCRSGGITDYFRLGTRGWDEVENIGGGFNSGITHCDCR